jgi:hypothetical protein
MCIFGVHCVYAILSCFFLYYVNYVESGFIFHYYKHWLMLIVLGCILVI